MLVGNVSSEMVSVTEGSALSLNCSVLDAVGAVVFTWQRIKSGDRVTEIEEGMRVQITSTPNASSLLILQVELMDEGMYCCMAADFFSQIKKQFTVAVKGEQCRGARFVLITLSLAKFVGVNCNNTSTMRPAVLTLSLFTM